MRMNMLDHVTCNACYLIELPTIQSCLVHDIQRPTFHCLQSILYPWNVSTYVHIQGVVDSSIVDVITDVNHVHVHHRIHTILIHEHIHHLVRILRDLYGHLLELVHLSLLL